MCSIKKHDRNMVLGFDTFYRSGLLVRDIFKEIRGLAVERLAQRVQGRKADSPALIVFENGQICERYIYHGRQLI